MSSSPRVLLSSPGEEFPGDCACATIHTSILPLAGELDQPVLQKSPFLIHLPVDDEHQVVMHQVKQTNVAVLNQAAARILKFFLALSH